MITSLSTRKYCERLIPILEKEIRVLRSFLKDFNPEEKHLSRNLPPELFPYVDPVVKTNAQLIEEWLQEGYETNGYPIDPKIYRAKKGEYVRSRLELTIANMLYDKQIPYRYECALYLDDGKAVYPDFTILHPETLETYWLEVFGMMDDPDYAASNYQKIARCAQNSMFPKLIMVFDHKDAPFRTETMEQILYNYFLS